EVPWLHWSTIVERVTRQLVSIDGVDSAIAVSRADAVDSVEELLILVDTFFVLGGSAIRLVRGARARRETVAGGDLRRSKDAVIGNIVEGTVKARCSSGYD